MTSRSSAQSRQCPGNQGCENKNNQDVGVGSKPGKSFGAGGGSSSFPKGSSRRREPFQGSLSGLNPHKPGPRTKGGPGKRPPPRGGHNNYPREKTYQNFSTHQIDEADECELGSIFNPGSKKQNYNHLLNFQYGNRGSAPRTNNHQRQKYDRKKYSQDLPRPKYDHTHYLQANCQFIVKAGEDYTVQAADPDILVNWDLIEQVLLRVCSSEETSCPICLFPPSAGKMSECGHVFCYTCILHYLALSDDTSRPCPICHQSVTKTGLKSVKIVTKHNYGTGECINMTLMKRERNSVFAVPVTNSFLSDNPDLHNMDVDRNYVKMFTANPQQIKTEILDKERRDLEKQWEEEKDQPESCFVQEALKLLDQRQMETMMRPKVTKKASPTKPEPTIPGFQSLAIASPTSPTAVVDPFAEEDVVTEPRPRHVSGVSSDSVSSGEDVSEIIDEGVTVTDLDISTVQPEPGHHGNQTKSVFYFYQSTDGQPIFLHALNVQMLVKQFGALENCPPVIQAEILEKEGAVMSDQMRDRLRYLKHLPVSTNFEVAELDMGHLVSKETLAAFKDQVETRKRKRNRKLRDEKRREKKIQHEEARLMGFPGRYVRVESDYYSSSSSVQSGADHFPAMADNEEVNDQDTSPATISFAKITKCKPVVAAPVVASTKPSTSGPTWACLGSVKPLQTVRNVKNVNVKTDSDQEPDNETDYVPPPPAASLGDTLAAALLAADDRQTNSKGKKGGKKGRGKTVLLSGGAPRPHV